MMLPCKYHVTQGQSLGRLCHAAVSLMHPGGHFGHLAAQLRWLQHFQFTPEAQQPRTCLAQRTDWESYGAPPFRVRTGLDPCRGSNERRRECFQHAQGPGREADSGLIRVQLGFEPFCTVSPVGFQLETLRSLEALLENIQFQDARDAIRAQALFGLGDHIPDAALEHQAKWIENALLLGFPASITHADPALLPDGARNER